MKIRTSTLISAVIIIPTLVLFCIGGYLKFSDAKETEQSMREAIGIYYSPYDEDGGEYIILCNNGGGLHYINYTDEGDPIHTFNSLKWSYSKKKCECEIQLLDDEGDPVYTFSPTMYEGYFENEGGVRYRKIDRHFFHQ